MDEEPLCGCATANSYLFFIFILFDMFYRCFISVAASGDGVPVDHNLIDFDTE